MGNEQHTLRTADALEFAGLVAQDWRNACRRGVYTEAPTTSMGRVTKFDADDLTAAHVLGRLLEYQIRVKVAGQVATDVRRLLRQLPDVQTLSVWKVAGKRGPRVVVAEHAPADTAVEELFKFEIAKLRELAAEGIRAKQQRAP